MAGSERSDANGADGHRPGSALGGVLVEASNAQPEEDLVRRQRGGGSDGTGRSSEPLWHTIQCATLQLASLHCEHVISVA